MTRGGVPLVGLLLLGACRDDATSAGGTDGATESGSTSVASSTGVEPTPETGETGDESSTGDEPPPQVECGDEITVGHARMRLLTRYEYDSTILSLLGDDSAPAQTFPAENQSTAFENNAVDHQVTKDTVRRYMEVAEDVAQAATANGLTTLLPCDPVGQESECGGQFIAEFGRRAFRRPLESDEQALFEGLLADALTEHDFTTAVAMTLQAILQSPQFLYRVEMVPGDAQPGDIIAVEDFELATRLSYFLAATTPDDTLLDAAAAGELQTVAQVEEHARRILETDAARDSVRHFHRQWLGLSALQSVNKDPAVYPELDAGTVAEDWSQSVQDFTEHVVFDGEGTLSSLFGSQKVFLSPSLAAFYGATADGEGAYTLEGDRAGLMTQPALMSLYAYPDRSSPIARGVWVRERLLCQALPPPPDDVDIEPPEKDPNATTREQFAQHTEEPSCAGCHALIDPLGFPFEHYDAVGRWRDEENGLPIDASGEFVGVSDEALQGPVADAVEMAERLAVSSDFQKCSTQQWVTFALGRVPDADADKCSLEAATAIVAESGNIKDLLVAIAVSDAFRYRLVDGGGQ